MSKPHYMYLSLTYYIYEPDIWNISNENWWGELENILEQIGMSENLVGGSEIGIAKEKNIHLK